MSNDIKLYTPVSNLQEGLDMIPKGDYLDFVVELEKRLGWDSRATLYRKRKGTTPVTLPDSQVIRKLFNEHGIDIDTLKHIPINDQGL